jgi:hypothetical protein
MWAVQGLGNLPPSLDPFVSPTLTPYCSQRQLCHAHPASGRWLPWCPAGSSFLAALAAGPLVNGLQAHPSCVHVWVTSPSPVRVYACVCACLRVCVISIILSQYLQ